MLENILRCEKLLKEAKQLFKIQYISDSKHERFLHGLLYPVKDGIYSYDYPALYVYAQVDSKDFGFDFFACIKSIDDAGVSIFGPQCEKEKSIARFDAFGKFLSELGHSCPSKDQILKFCRKHYLSANFW